MDVGPFRAPQPTDRRVASRPEPSRPPETQLVHEEQSRGAIPKGTRTHKKSPRRLVWFSLIALLVIAIGIGGWFAWSKMQTTATEIDTSKYQAVFFTNGQVYFGKLHQLNSDYLKLTDIYYLQTQTANASQNPQQTSTDQGNVQLIKLGDEIHGPEDEMVISKDQVLFYENLKSDGKVAQSIEKFKKSN